MFELNVPLNRIMPNPWQTRQVEPAAGDVAALAADIAARGLLQVPLGRLVNADGTPCLDPELAARRFDRDGFYNVQLAFGHHRLAAFQFLAQQDGAHYGRLPVRIVLLDNQAMALAAWSENAQRKNLSPLEEAQALQRLLADFEWTQEQVAEHVGLNRATIANKLRLLRLPEDMQKKLHSGMLSERQALAILPVCELPAAALARIDEKRQGGHDWTIQKLDEVLAHPDKKSSGDVREIIRDAVAHVTHALSAAKESEWGRGSFPVDQEIAGVAAPACLACANRLQETRCADGDCFAQKQAAFEGQELAFAVAATGLPIVTNAAWQALPWAAKKNLEASDKAGLQRALDQQCPNLRLRYEREDPRPYNLRHPDYPHVGFVCVHAGADLCECADAAAAKREAKEQAAAEKRKKEAAALREKTVKELAAALRNQDLGAWRAVLWSLRSYSYHQSGKADKVASMDQNTTLENIARAVLSNAVQWDAVRPGQRDIAADLAAWREKVGWVAAAEG